jgi:peptide deformylase
MPLLTIHRFDDKILSQIVDHVGVEQFGKDLELLITSMAETMYYHKGVGLAGPQVGFLGRVLVADTGYLENNKYGSGWIGMVNPEVIETSNTLLLAEEGCLSYPSFAQKVERPESALVKFFSPLGEEGEAKFNGFQARIILHEIDHLNGITLLSRASRMRKASYLKKINKVRKSMKKAGV